jgi:hypothetical protein
MAVCEFCFITTPKNFSFCKHQLCADCLSDIYDSSSLKENIKCPICSIDPILVIVHQEGHHLEDHLKHFGTIKDQLQKIVPNLQYFMISLDRWGNLKDCVDPQRGQEYAKYGPCVLLVPSSVWNGKSTSKIGTIIMNGMWEHNVIRYDFKYSVREPEAWGRWLKDSLLDKDFRKVQGM